MAQMVIKLRTAAVAALLLACSTVWAMPEAAYSPQQHGLTSAAQSSTVISELLSRLLQESDVTVPIYGPTYPPSYGPTYGPGYGAAPPSPVRRSFLLSTWFANANSHARNTEAGWANANSHQEILKRLLLDDVLLSSNTPGYGPGYGPAYPPSYGGYGAPPPATTAARKLLAAAALQTTAPEDRFATIVRKLRTAASAHAAN